MIKKATDSNCLSGVSSPLLTLFYSALSYSENSRDGLYVQYDSAGNVQSLIGLENGNAVVENLSSEDYAEIKSFLDFCHTKTVTSSAPLTGFCGCFKEYSYMSRVVEAVCGEGSCDYLFNTSRLSEYRSVYDLVFSEYGDFEKWYCNFSKRINDGNAVASYLINNGVLLSAAVVTCIYGGNALLSGVFTPPVYRKKGYAGECIKGVINKLSDRKIKTISLWCEKNNVRFYENLGFSVNGKIYVGECK